VKFKSYNTILKTVIALAVLTILGSCGGESNPNEIIIWTQMRSEGRDILQSRLDEYMRLNPELTILQTYYETEEMRSNFIFSALGKGGPDLVFGPADNVGPLAAIDVLQPLEEIFPDPFFVDFVPDASVWRTVRGEKHMFMIADRIGNHLALCYNKALVPEPPRTMSELFRIGKELTRDFDGDGLMDQYALAWNYVEPYFMIPFLGSYGGWVMDENENPTLDTQAMRDAASLILKIRSVHKIVPSYCDYDIAMSLFKQGKAAMIIDGPWAWGEYGKAGIDYGITRIPFNEESGMWPMPMVSPLGWVINVNTTGDRLLKVKKLLRFLMSKETQMIFMNGLNTIPTHKEALADTAFFNNELVQASLYAREVGRMMPTTPALRGVWNAMKPSYQAIINGSISPEEASAKMQKDAEKFIAEMFQQY